jgi:four helix bundle protein
MSRTRHYRDLIAWQKAMDLARMIYGRTEEFPRSETFGLRMQLRRAAVSVASHIAEAHGRLNDAEMRKGLGAARAAINELQTQTELAARAWASSTALQVRNSWISQPASRN